MQQPKRLAKRRNRSGQAQPALQEDGPIAAAALQEGRTTEGGEEQRKDTSEMDTPHGLATPATVDEESADPRHHATKDDDAKGLLVNQVGLEEEDGRDGGAVRLRYVHLSCHCCKTKSPYVLACLRDRTHRYCRRCLGLRFGVEPDQATRWSGLTRSASEGCPKCQDKCPCNPCRRRRGEPASSMGRSDARGRDSHHGRGGGVVRLECRDEGRSWTRSFDRDHFRSTLFFRPHFLPHDQGA